jgi:hypothetical protein
MAGAHVSRLAAPFSALPARSIAIAAHAWRGAAGGSPGAARQLAPPKKEKRTATAVAAAVF